MSDVLEILNTAPLVQFSSEMLKCCGSKSWAERMAKRRPFSDAVALHQVAKLEWFSLESADFLEAFSHHPRIGDRVKSGSWASNEQSKAQAGDLKILEQIRQLNEAYEKKFGHVFLICATGKSAPEILSELKRRIDLSREDELVNASIEQSKITEIRLNKLLAEGVTK